MNLKIQNKNLAWTGWAQDFVNRINNSGLADINPYDNKPCLNYQSSASYKEYDTKYMFKTNFKPNTQYTFSFDINSASDYGNIVLQHTDGTVVEPSGLTVNAWNHVILTSSPNKTIKYLRVNWRTSSSHINLDTFMVLEGAFTSQTIPPYIPHQEQNLPFTFSSGQALMQGGMLTDSGVYNARKQIVLTGTENWVQYQTYIYLYIADCVKAVSSGATIPNIKCNQFTANSRNTTYATQNNNYITDNALGATENQRGICFINNANFSTVAECKQFLADKYANNTPVIVEYEFATPTTTAYTSTQQSQYNAIKNAISYNEQTNISSTSSDLPADLEAVAIADMNAVFQALQSRVDLLEG